MIYVSTGGFRNIKPAKIVQSFNDRYISNIELSSGLYFNNTLKELLKIKESSNFLVHNYFPPPRMPFVFNLGSLNKEVSEISFKHAKKAIDWSKQLGGSVYSFHAGFLLNPNVNELGKRIRKRKLFNRDESMHKFIENVNLLSEYAHKNKIELLIENNVLSYNNYKEFNDNPFLMADYDEAQYIMERSPQNVNLLMDFAHLKVSSKTLKLKPKIFFKLCSKWIKGYHLSDNDGLSDSNQKISDDSWFWDYINRDFNVTIEVYSHDIEFLYSQYELVKNKLS